MLKKVLLAAAIILTCTFAGVPQQTAFAQNEGTNANPTPQKTLTPGSAATKLPKKSKAVKEIDEYDKGIISAGKGDLNLAGYTSKTVMYTGLGISVNALMGNPVEEVATLPDGSQVTYITREGGALQSVGDTLAMLYDNPAADTRTAVADAMQSFGFGVASPAYAQGVGLGFASLSPILELWKLFRNIAYFFFVLVILAIGFMIMFRKKMGQTAVTAQQAIPNVIVALLSVSFSYAIAGFMIDIMYLIMYFIVGVFSVTPDLITHGILQIGTGAIVNSFTDTWAAMDDVICDALPVACNFTEGWGANGAYVNSAVGISSLGGWIVAVVVSVAILISIFRLFFEMIKTYITIVLSIATAPILLMLNAIPGRNTFSKWLQNLIGNLSAFPMVLIIFTIFYKIKDLQLTFGSTEGGGFNPPYVLFNGNPAAIVSILGIGMLMIITDLVIQGKKAMGAGGGIFEQFAGNLSDAFKKGWTGDANLIPGMGWSNLGRYGISGKGASQGLAALWGGVPMAAYNAAKGTDWNSRRDKAMSGFLTGAGIAGNLSGNKFLNTKSLLAAGERLEKFGQKGK